MFVLKTNDIKFSIAIVIVYVNEKIYKIDMINIIIRFAKI